MKRLLLALRGTRPAREGGTVTLIRDFRYVPYITQGASYLPGV